MRVGRIFELRDDDRAVDDVEVAVTRRQPLTLAEFGRWQREFDDPVCLPFEICHLFELFKVCLERPVICVGWIFLPSHDDGLRIAKPRELIDVAIGIITRELASREPQNPVRTQKPEETASTHKNPAMPTDLTIFVFSMCVELKRSA